MFNVAILGAEAAETYEYFKKRCIFYLKNRAKEGITIYAVEEHEFVTKFASEYHINIQYFYTDWKMYGKKALVERNKLLISTCCGIIWFDDKRKDTQMIVNLAKKTGTPVRDALKYKD